MRQRAGGSILQNLRFRNRLIILIFIPTAVAVLLGGLQVVLALSSTQAYQRVQDMADFNNAVNEFVHELAIERDLSVVAIAKKRSPDKDDTIVEQRERVDGLASEVVRQVRIIDGAYPPNVGQQVRRATIRVSQLRELRGFIAAALQAPPQQVSAKYSRVITDLLVLTSYISQDSQDTGLGNNVRALAALGRAKEEASVQRGLLASVMAKRSNARLDPAIRDRFVGSTAQFDSDLVSFRTEASLDQIQVYQNTVAGPEVDRTAEYRYRAAVIGDLAPDAVKDSGDWFAMASVVIGKMRDVEKTLNGSIKLRAADLQAGEYQAALLSAGVVLLVLILVLIVTALIARATVHPLRWLRREALEIAGVRLPECVNRMRTATPGEVPRVRPIGVRSRDEIGEVARAFDEVHQEAVRLAAQETRLRANVNAMFVNLARRSQTLIERLLRIIDRLEYGEQNTERLQTLFKLDHLATRMRRNSENLLVLAGQDQPRRWSEPVPMLDVLRAAVSEVEQYRRVSMRLTPGTAIVGQAVNDVVHLIAELVENATLYSPEDTPVTIATHRLTGSGDAAVMVTISDNGIGMVPDELSEANRRLSEPQEVDVSVSRQMGHFVVSRLASRHGVRVRLRPSQDSGLTAMILLPSAITALDYAQDEPAPAVDTSIQIRASASREPPPPELVAVPKPLSRRDLSPATPAGRDSRPQPSGGGSLPIYDTLRSDWFRRNPAGDVPAGDAPAVRQRQWDSPGDAGWSSAHAVITRPQVGDRTSAGLPRRVPRANLLPGSVGAATAPAPSPAAESPDLVRDRYASLQRGVERARHTDLWRPGRD